ncbi:MAG: ankyrin repeat domain-containing protein [Acidobacteria bacterium]|nr:ankyrin repeat domain-containing protein [Acidobacteriota bacterium]
MRWVYFFLLLVSASACSFSSNSAPIAPKDLIQAIMDADEPAIKAALARPYDPEAVNVYGDTALIWATHRRMPIVIQKLLAAGADVDHAGSEGKTPLMWACEEGFYQEAEILLNHQAQMDFRDLKGRTPLHWASFKCRTDVVRLLLDHGAAVDVLDRWGQTPLMFSIHGQCPELTELLVLAGSTLDHISSQNETVFDVANKLNRRHYLLTDRLLREIPDLQSRLDANLVTIILNEKDQPKLDLKRLAYEVHDEVNRVRAEHGLSALTWSEPLKRTAEDHSFDMAKREYFNHYNPEGEDPSARARRHGVRQGAGENLYMCHLYSGASMEFRDGKRFVERYWEDPKKLAAKAVEGWMNSPGHRANILNGQYQTEGIGIALSDKLGVYFTQNLSF